MVLPPWHSPISAVPPTKKSSKAWQARGVDRRFDFKLKNDRLYSQRLRPPPSGNSPKREVRPRVVPRQEDNRHLPAPLVHPYRDFYRDFADSLSLSDEVILTEIYPAREQPIPRRDESADL